MTSGGRHFRAVCLIAMAGWCLTPVMASTVAAQNEAKEIIGYFPSWKWRGSAGPSLLEKISFRKFSIINYAFFFPLPDGSIRGRDSTGDRLYLQSAGGASLIRRAHAAGARVVLSIGGWEDSGNFPAVAATPAGRVSFAHACMEAIRTYGFDGVDIDWEFPTFAEHNGTPADTRNFTLLLSTVRDSITATGMPLLLTAALPAGDEHLKKMEMENITRLLDRVHCMTYDFNGPWSALSGHNSPLYPSGETDSSNCVDGAFTLLHQRYGVPLSKLTLGVPFYGHTFAGCITMGSPHKGTDTVHFYPPGAFYTNIVASASVFTRKWDERAQVPYLVSTTWKTLVSYDDGESVAAKARYVMQKGVRGLIIWEITGDMMPDGTTPLLDAIRNIFQAGAVEN